MTRHNIEPQGDHVIKGFYDPQTGDLRVQLGLPTPFEGAVNCAFGMDGSGSMADHYRHSGWSHDKPSEVEKFLHEAAAFVADLDSDKGVQVYAWATGDGTRVADQGNFPQDQLETLRIKTNVDSHDRDAITLGSGTYLAPALDYMVQKIVIEPGAKYGLLVLTTDGKLSDFADVVTWATKKAKGIQAGTHPLFKVVLVGFDDADKAQMEALDNLDTGTDVDIFNALQVANLHGAMEALNGEALTSGFTVASGGYLEANGVQFPFEGGVPQRIDTKVTPGLKSIDLVIVEDGAEADRLKIALPS